MMSVPRTPVAPAVALAVALAFALAVAVSLAGCKGSDPVVVDTKPPGSSEQTTSPEALALDDIEISLDKIVEGFDQPLYVTGAGDGSGRLFVVEKTGRIWIVRDGEKSARPWLDISDMVSTDSEQGLLGLAFAPDFAESGTFYVDYTRADGATVVARVTASDPASNDPVDFTTEQQLLTQEQPYANHNGGMVTFGPDGYLYIGLGDGGSGGDPHGNGQNLATWLGKLLRINVSGASGATDESLTSPAFTVPDDNPFAGGAAAESGGAPRAEIWAYGLRNPWRFSFDRQTGDLWIGDVGQNSWEEIDFQPADSPGGENYGWNVYEATHPFPVGSAAVEGDFTMPVIEYDRDAGQSVTGGYVYRGSEFPSLAGTYFYGDYESGHIWGLQRTAAGIKNRLMLMPRIAIVSFGEDDAGELYVLDFGGALYRVVSP